MCWRWGGRQVQCSSQTVYSEENAIGDIKRWGFLQRTIDAKQFYLISLIFYIAASLPNYIMRPKAPREEIDTFQPLMARCARVQDALNEPNAAKDAILTELKAYLVGAGLDATVAGSFLAVASNM